MVSKSQQEMIYAFIKPFELKNERKHATDWLQIPCAKGLLKKWNTFQSSYVYDVFQKTFPSRVE